MVAVFWVLFSVGVGILASNKGRSGLGWFVLSLLISPLLGLLFVAVLKSLAPGAQGAGPSAETHVKCPACAEFVLPEAAVCKHCGAALLPDPGFQARKAAEKDAAESADRKALWLWGGGIVLLAFLLSLFTS